MRLYCYIKPDAIGDLAALGNLHVPGAREYTTELKSRWVPTKYAWRLYGGQEDATVINLGDSFSGLAPSFIDYCASSYDGDIYSANDTTDELFNNAMALLNNGTLERMGTKVVIVESIERYFFNRLKVADPECVEVPRLLRGQFEWDKKAPEGGVQNTIYYMPPEPKFSFAEVINSLLIISKNNAVKEAKLDKPMFNIGEATESTLFFYQDDIFNPFLDETELKFAQAKLNQMYDKFASHGIELIILCFPDKYYAYQDHIVDNKFPISCAGEQMSKLKLNGQFIYAGAHVKSLIAEGKMDVYFNEDAHWSPVAGKPFGEELSKVITKTLERRAEK